MPRHVTYILFLSAFVSLIMASGCTSLMSSASADIIYTPPSQTLNLKKKPIYLAFSDERPAHYVAINAGITVPIISQVDIHIDRPGLMSPSNSTEKLVSPAQAAALALGARLNSMGYPVYPEESLKTKKARVLVLYVYSFSADFSEKSIAITNVTLALGRATQRDAKLPFSPLPSPDGTSIYAPICSRSSALGSASTLEGKNGIRVAGDALSEALSRAVNTLKIEDCL